MNPNGNAGARGLWPQDRLEKLRVLVVGAGALGNEVLKNLALLRVGHVVIMDFDRIEAHNLSRSVLFRAEDAEGQFIKAMVAAQRIVELHPGMSVKVLMGDVVTDLSLGLLSQVDVVIGCVDNRLARLYLNRLCWRAGKPWVDGGILNLSGQVAVYGPGRACYECGLTELAWKEIRTRLGCTDMARRYAVDGHAPTTPIAASVIGALQVQEAIKAALGIETGSLMGKMLSVEGDHAQFTVYEQRALREECMSHFAPETPIVCGLTSQSAIEELWAVLGKMGIASPSLQLEHSVALELEGVKTGRRYPVVLPLPMYSDAIKQELEEIAGEELVVPRGVIVEEVRPGMGLENVELWRLGIPMGHWLRTGRGEDRLLLALELDQSLFQRSESGWSILGNPWWEATADALKGWWNGLANG